MNELLKTLIFVVVALVLTGAAFVSTRDRTRRTRDRFNDQGKPFFPEFKDPLACTDLEVVSFEPSTATASRFRVMFKNNKWVIPSHYDYPADARDRLSKTAAAVMDLTKDTIRSDKVEEQQDDGGHRPARRQDHVAPGAGQAGDPPGCVGESPGRFHHRQRDQGDGAEGRRRRTHYVRVPDQKRTYGVAVKADLSTKFADWIETNLLKVEAGRIRRIVFDNYRLMEDRDAPGPVHEARARGQGRPSNGRIRAAPGRR